jgi:hypothetical protein
MRLKAAAVLMAALCATCAAERRNPTAPAAAGASVRGVDIDPELLKRYRVHSLDEGQANFCNGKPCTGL